MLMNNHQIRNLVRSTCLGQVLDDVVSSIYAMRVGKDETHLLGKLEEF